MTAPAPARRGRPRKPLRIEYRRPWLYPKQEAALFHPARYVDIEASTKAGKSTGALAWLNEQAILKGAPGREFWWVAPVYGQSRVMFERWCRAVDPAWYTKDEGALCVELPNGARIRFRSGERPDTLYGDDVWAAVTDEASRTKEGVRDAIRSTLTATQGPWRRIGNVRGRGNWWFKECRKSEAGGNPRRHYAKLTAYDAAAGGLFPLEEIEDARESLTDAVFRELYLAEPTEDGANPFDYRPVLIQQLAPGPAIAYGVDLGSRLTHTEIVGLNAHRHMCEYMRFQAPWAETMRRIRAVVGSVPTLVDATGVGAPVLEMMTNPAAGLSPLAAGVVHVVSTMPELPAAMSEEAKALLRSAPNIQGYVFTSTTRQSLLEYIAAQISQRAVRIYAGPAGELAAQFEAFEFQYLPKSRTVRYASPEGVPDDGVFAVGLALECFRTVGTRSSAGGVLVDI